MPFNFNGILKTKKIKLPSYLLFLLLHFVSIICCGQSQLVLNKINQTNGLSNDRVRAIVKEKNGFVWVGTENGLNRYDGHKIKVYNKQNSNLSSNDISDLLIDKKGKIWIATLGGGLNLYNPQKDNFIVFRNNPKNNSSITSNELNSLFEDGNNTFWIGTKNGISCLNEANKNFTSFKFDSKNKQSLSHNDVRCFFEDKNNNIWIGTFGGGLSKFNFKTKRFERINFSPEYIHAICGINDNEILLGTNGFGLMSFYLKDASFLKKELKSSKTINIVRSIKRDSQLNVWIGTDGDGLFKIRNINSLQPLINHFTNEIQSEVSISSNAIYAMMEDENSNVWLGTAWNGVDVLSVNSDYNLLPSSKKGEAPVSVLSIYKNANALFTGLDGKGLTVFDTKSNAKKQYNSQNKNALGDDYIQSITEAKDGTLWIGTFVNGLVNFDYKTEAFTQFKQNVENPKALSFNDVRSVVEDEKNNFWIATWGGGLNYFNSKTKEFKSYKKQNANPNSISSDNVISIQKDKNSLWLGTFGGGLSHFDITKNRFKNYKNIEGNQNSISSNYVYSVLKDSKENIWIGTAGEGINLLDKKTNKINRFETNKNIRYQTVTAIIEDNKGLIWFSTKQGIFNFNYTTKTFKNYASLKGDYHINACFKDEKGILYFGSSNGVIQFNPESIKLQNLTPKVKFTSFKLFNKEVVIGKDDILQNNISVAKEINLKHNHNVISFEFAAMLFPSSANCEYEIKMENFDDNWRFIGKESSATYTNLSPGDYEFKVKSRAVGSNWSNEYSSIKITIQKPFWTRWWAFVLYFIIAVFLLRLAFKYLVSWEKMKADLRFEKFSHEKDVELYNLKQDFFTNISHEIRTPVTLILSAINALIKDNSSEQNNTEKSIGTLTKNGNHLLNLVNELLDYRKLEHQKINLKVAKSDFVLFCKEIYLSFKEFASQKEVQFEFESTTSNIELWFDKNQMEKVLYNLFSNAIKFTNTGGVIKILISESETDVKLQVIDEGVGISSKNLAKIFNRFYQTSEANAKNGAGFGLGLTIANEIVKLHHGEISVESKLGSGSTFAIKLIKGNAFYEASEIAENEVNEEQIENYFTQLTTVNETSLNDNQSQTNKEKALLIVEDNEEIRNYIATLLGDEFQILQASNGKEGLEIAIDKSPDLIISDVMMPVMDGVALTKQLKSNAETSHIPVILLTARASFVHKMAGFETGADDYITKPFNESLLRARIKNLLWNRSLLHEKFKTEDSPDGADLVKNKKDQEFLQKLGAFIEKNIDSETLSVVFVAQELGMSHSVLYKKLKTITGLSLVEYMRDYRLKKAKQLLKTKQFTLTEICFQVGYSDRKYFSKLFKERFGNPPSFYLKGE